LEGLDDNKWSIFLSFRFALFTLPRNKEMLLHFDLFWNVQKCCERNIYRNRGEGFVREI